VIQLARSLVIGLTNGGGFFMVFMITLLDECASFSWRHCCRGAAFFPTHWMKPWLFAGGRRAQECGVLFDEGARLLFSRYRPPLTINHYHYNRRQMLHLSPQESDTGRCLLKAPEGSFRIRIIFSDLAMF